MLILTTLRDPAATLEPPVEGGVVVHTVTQLVEALEHSPVGAVLLDEACDRETIAAAADVLRENEATTFLWVERCCLESLERVLQLDLDCLAPYGMRPKELRAVIDDYVAMRRLAPAREHAVQGAPGALSGSFFSGFIGRGQWLDELSRVLPRIARSSASVLVQGETGTGKELVARGIHRLSARRHGPFLAINCGATPEHLIESELFGHEKGSFTGATAQKLGRFEMADKGTLFLDEVGELSEPAQAKLLRALQGGTIDRVGGTEPRAVDVRIIAATNRTLDVDGGGALRADLLFRLQVLSVRLPPLRDRSEDVLPLWISFLETARQDTHSAPLRTHPSVSSALLAHRWPGNVRELHNAAVHAATLADDVIERHHLPAAVAAAVPAAKQQDAPRLCVPGMSLKEIERIAICDALRSTSSIRAAAEMLGISRRTIQYRLSEYREEAGGGLASDDHHDDVGVSQAQGARPRPRLLLAEDDNDVRHALEALLVRAGYEVIALNSGGAVLQYLGGALLLHQWRGAPDVIVSDVRMPGMTGMQLLQGMHRNGWNVPIVLMTAFADDDLREQARAMGAAAFLDKPLDATELERVVAAALQGAPEATVNL